MPPFPVSWSILKPGLWDTFEIAWLWSLLPLLSRSSSSFCLYYSFPAWFWLNFSRFLSVKLCTEREHWLVNFGSPREPYCEPLVVRHELKYTKTLLNFTYWQFLRFCIEGRFPHASFYTDSKAIQML